jgi:hypothetical protein
MAFSSNAPVLEYKSVDTFPLSETLTGTVTSNGKIVVGVGTLFTTEIGYNGDDNSIVRKPDLGYIWNGLSGAGGGEWRQVTDVISDTLLYIDSEFDTPLTADVIKRIPTCRATKVDYLGHEGTPSIDGIDVKLGENGFWKIAEFTNKPIQPHIIGGTSGDILHLTITY